MLFKNALCTGFVAFTLVSIVATSSLDENISSASLRIKSDCVLPPEDMEIVTQDDQIIEPIGVVYSDFGFPDDVVRLDTPVEGTMGSGALRICKKTYGERDSGGVWIFTCEDDGEYACTITLEDI